MSKEISEFERWIDESIKGQIIELCPFCKGKAEVFRDPVGNACVQCTDCGIVTRMYEVDFGESVSEAINAWNKRVESTKETEIAIGNDSPFTTADLLLKLADATDVLLHQHNYDGHGYELIQQAQAIARQRAGELKKNNISGWVPVSERLPEPKTLLIVTRKTPHWEGEILSDVIYSITEKDGAGFYKSDKDWAYTIKLNWIVAWRLLEPYCNDCDNCIGKDKCRNKNNVVSKC